MKYVAFYPQNVDFSHFREIFCHLLKKITQPPNIRCSCGRAPVVLPSWYYDFYSYLQPFGHKMPILAILGRFFAIC